jgi:hypothetical protein
MQSKVYLRIMEVGILNFNEEIEMGEIYFMMINPLKQS